MFSRSSSSFAHLTSRCLTDGVVKAAVSLAHHCEQFVAVLEMLIVRPELGRVRMLRCCQRFQRCGRCVSVAVWSDDDRIHDISATSVNQVVAKVAHNTVGIDVFHPLGAGDGVEDWLPRGGDDGESGVGCAALLLPVERLTKRAESVLEG